MSASAGSRIRRALGAWVPPLLWMGLIFWLSSQSNPPSPGFTLPDQAWHAIFYFILGALLGRATRPSGPAGALLGVVIGSAYGFSDEVHQRFVPGRTYDLGDWAFDILGATAGVLLVALLARRRR